MSACFDEGILQAYADGELDAARAQQVSAHVSTCAACASVVEEAAEHFALLSSALGTNEALNVPTERLRARIDAAIAGLQPTPVAQSDAFASQATASPSFVERLRAFASSLVAAQRQATAFASLFVAAVLLATIFFLFRPQSRAPKFDQSGGGQIAQVNQQTGAGGSATGGSSPGNPSAGSEDNKRAGSVSESDKGQGPGAGGQNVNRSRIDRGTRQAASSAGVVNAGYARPGTSRFGPTRPDNDALNAALLPVEQPYASAAASLKSSIDVQAARVMTPTLRAEYVRNLAVVDRAIAASRDAARRNPTDRGAQEFLRAAYEDKLELLRTVSDETQIASIGRQ